jgi:hypothetical protein
VTKSSDKFLFDELRRANEQTSRSLYVAPSFKFKHELRPQERPYDYYEAHPEFKVRRPRRLLRRRIIREG